MTERRITKATLQDAIQAGRLGLDELLEQIPRGLMLEPILDNGWSIKDVIAHITAWEQRLLGWLATAANGDTPQIPAKGYTWDDVDRLNEERRAQTLSSSLEDTLASYRASMSLLYAALDRLSDDDLNSYYFPDQEGMLWQYFAANTYEHYIEHGAVIRTWLKENGYLNS
jgi:hypothetical protein